jgi:outer membrane immunogenic protein
VKAIIGAAALSICFVATAHADGMARGSLKDGPVSLWQGCYVGIQAGWAWGDSQHVNSAGPLTPSFDIDGGLVGGTWGCNSQFGRLVVGFESDLAWANKQGSAQDIPPFNTAFFSETRERWIGTTRLRIGHARDNWLFYATGGLALANAEITVCGPDPFGCVSENKDRFGFTYGGGVEWAFGPKWSAKFEYLRVEFPDKDYFSPPPAGFADRANGVQLDDNIVRVGLNYRWW